MISSRTTVVSGAARGLDPTMVMAYVWPLKTNEVFQCGTVIVASGSTEIIEPASCVVFVFGFGPVASVEQPETSTAATAAQPIRTYEDGATCMRPFFQVRFRAEVR